jgi:hypothetical protein
LAEEEGEFAAGGKAKKLQGRKSRAEKVGPKKLAEKKRAKKVAKKSRPKKQGRTG